ncbi:hypothetical protein HRbin36_01976 [bacterium HR36]|nr:hypothetical protein HRbin36_01976 [bacterium HR36]
MGDDASMLRVATPSRLHFGLLVPGAGDRRRFGGLGLALTQPRLLLEAHPAPAWTITGPEAERAHQCLQKLLQHSELAQAPPLHIKILEHIPAHVGLGSGTQLALALAWLLGKAAGLRPTLADLLRWTGRAARSVVGTAAFARGGFILDFGQRHPASPTPTFLRLEFPPPWHIAVLLPQYRPGLHGPAENEVFAQLGPEANRLSERLCRLALLEILPALLERRYFDFAEGLWEYNRLAGECFRPWQGGSPYNEMVGQITATIRERGLPAVGQSSWGPALFAIAPADLLGEMLQFIRQHYCEAIKEIIITTANATGAWYETAMSRGRVFALDSEA